MASLSNYSANSQFVVKAFAALFGAGVTGDLVAAGDSLLTAGNSKTALVNVLLNNSVVLNSFPLFGANVTNDAFAGALIDNMTKGSGVDAATIAGWKTAVAAAIPSYASRAAAVTALIDSVTNYSGSDANLSLVKAVVNNRAEVGAFKAQNGASTFSTLSSLQTQVASVDATAASVTAAQTTTNEAATSYVLTTAQDLFTGTNADNVFRAVAGNANGTQDQTTLNSSDIIDGGVGADTLIVNMTGANYNGGARIKNIETLQIGTNQAAATFDYNVNAGSNEVTEVKTIVADQINTGEALTINNLVRDNATAAIPAMSWVNDNTGANGLAGTVNLNYRAATVSGTADEQALSLTNVRAGTLNLATGIEKVTLTSAGTATNSIDKVQSGTTLTDVVIKAAAQLGGNRVVSTADATKGLEINRTATNANTEHNSFVNMGASVKNVTAEGSAAGVNIAFTDTTAVDNTFVGGDGADSVIVNGGNDKLSGGKGADTFIFGQTNTSANGTFFNNSDTIDGGEGTDTIQFDYGNGAVTIQTSEWLNSKGVDAIDLRGQNNRVQLDDAFVGRADATSFEVITNKIVQNDAANSVSDEVSSRHQIDLSTVGANRAVKVTGGEGRETVIVTDALNGMQTLSGGNGLDVLVVKNGATLTGQDLQNVSGFNVMNLVKTSGNAQVFNIDLSASFLTKAIDANAAAGTSVNTANLFRIVTDGADASGNNNSLSGVQEIGAGDTINLTIDTAGLTAGSGAINVNDLLATAAAVNIRDASGQTLVTKAANVGGAITVAATAGNIFTAANATATADAAYTTTGAASVGSLTTSGQASTGGGGAAPVAGNTFTLTAAATDLLALTAGSDTVTSNSAASFQTGDNVADANAGTDSDSISVQIGLTAQAPTVTNVETINLDFFPGTTFNATNVTMGAGGTTTINADSTLGATAFTINNLNNRMAVGVDGTATTLTIDSATNTTTDAVTVNLNGANVTLDTNGTAANDFNVLTLAQAAGTNNTVTLANDGNVYSAATDQITVTGAGNFRLNADKAIITGIRLAGTAPAVFTLGITDAAASGIAVDLSNVTGVDAIAVTDGAGAQTVTYTNVASGATTTFDSEVGAVTIDSTDAASATHAITTVVADGANNRIGNIVTTELATLTLNLGTSATTTNTEAFNLDMGNVVGTQSLIFGASNVAVTIGTLTNADVINASALTAAAGTTAFTITTNSSASAMQITGAAAANNVIVGSAQDDVIIGGSANDTITGGAGNDTITLGGGTDRVVLDQITGRDTITGFGSGDTLAITHANANGGEVQVTAALAAGAATALTSDRTYVIEQAVGTAASLKTGGTATLAAADLTAATLTNLATFLSEAYANDAGNADTATFVINNGGNSYVYAFNAAAGTTTAIVAAELSLIGVVNSYAVLAADVAQA